jgi:hydrogenase maturation factor
VTLPFTAADACATAEGHCITCSDEAVPVTVVTVDAERELALCETADGRRETIEIALVSPVLPAERLLVHAGTAIARQGGVS